VFKTLALPLKLALFESTGFGAKEMRRDWEAFRVGEALVRKAIC
jgi:hypothetical protein